MHIDERTLNSFRALILKFDKVRVCTVTWRCISIHIRTFARAVTCAFPAAPPPPQLGQSRVSEIYCVCLEWCFSHPVCCYEIQLILYAQQIRSGGKRLIDAKNNLETHAIICGQVGSMFWKVLFLQIFDSMLVLCRCTIFIELNTFRIKMDTV